MRILSQIEQAYVSGGEVQVVVPIDPNKELSFKGGFDSSVNMISGFAGFVIGIPCSLVILPVRAGIWAYGGITDFFFSKKA